MGTLYLAGNETAVFGAHLQFVYEQNRQFFELEIQGSLNPDADWNYVSATDDDGGYLASGLLDALDLPEGEGGYMAGGAPAVAQTLPEGEEVDDLTDMAESDSNPGWDRSSRYDQADLATEDDLSVWESAFDFFG